MRTISICLLHSVALVFAAPALAEPIKFKPLLDARLRYENVDQAGIAETADAMTLRSRLGAEFSSGPFAVLAEAEGTLAINEDYNSGVNGRAQFPLVGDPENIELNRIQLQFKGLPKTVVTVGRQRINLDDQRFVGSVGWRQNEQTFDAARVEWTGFKDVKVDVTYAWSDRTIWGIDGFGARQPAIEGDNLFANLSWKHKYGTLTGFAYLVDQDEAAVQNFQLSSQTYGVRFVGAYPISKTMKLTYAASYARQSDYHRNPNDYAADYWLGEFGAELNAFKVGVGYEVLGADTGSALTSVQTPLATLHKFNGWADKFLTTPPNGLRDLYVSGGYSWKKVAPFDSVTLTAMWHDYRSDRLRLNYGEEIDVQLAAKIGKYAFTLKYADYNAQSFATDTSKFWASVEWAF